MDKALVNLGLDGARLEIAGNGKKKPSTVDEKTLRGIVETLERLEERPPRP